MLVVLQAMSRRGGVVVDDDVLYRFRLRLFSLAEELHNVRAACRIFGVHPSTYYRWRPAVLASGLEMLRPRERRPPRMPNQLSPVIEERIVAFSLGHPGLGPRRGSARLAQERWGGPRGRPNRGWGGPHPTPLNPAARKPSGLARRVAADLAARGWRLEGVLTDNGSEFRSGEFGAAVRELGARQRFIHPGRPTTNGAVERVQRTI